MAGARRFSVTRRNLLCSIIPAAGAAAYPLFVEPRWLRVVDRRLPFFGQAGSPVRLVQLSDLHASEEIPASHIEHAVQRAIEAAPDLICVTGDFVTGTTGFSMTWLRDLLRRLAVTAPAFAVLGNHDGGLWARGTGGFATTGPIRDVLSAAGVRLLHNEQYRFEVAGRTLQLVGTGDLWARELDGATAFRDADPNLPCVLLSHNPDSKDILARHEWKLMLSGHTHGGQLRLPLVGTPFAPVVDKNYVDDLRPWNGRWIHVSRGVGGVSGGVRFNCRPEVNVITLG